jgi:hypothetical protein
MATGLMVAIFLHSNGIIQDCYLFTFKSHDDE